MSPKIQKYDLDETLDPVKNKIEDGSRYITAIIPNCYGCPVIEE